MRYPRDITVGRVFLCIALLLGAGMLSLTRPFRDGASPATPAKEAIEQNNIGVGFMNQYLYKQAAAAFEKALAADQSFNLARVNLGIALLYDGALERAAAALEEALARDPKNPYGHFCLGLILKDRGEVEKAEAHFLRVVEADPNNSFAQYNLGVVYSRRQKDKEAEAAWQRALELDATNTSAMYNLGTLFLKTGRTAEGKKMLERFRGSQKGGALSGTTGAGTQYGEMGEYALTQDYKPRSVRAKLVQVSHAMAAPFVDRTEEAGLSKIVDTEAWAALPGEFPAEGYSLDLLKTRVLGSLGGGIALGDLDGDSSIDAVVTRYNSKSRLWETFIFLNDGKGHFSDITESSGIHNSGTQISSAIGDYDNDGLPDVYLVGLGGNTLYRNLGHGKFQDVTATAGVDDSGLCISATFVDYDHDGDLDLYVCHFLDVSKKPQGDPLTFPDSFPGEPDCMFRNNGNGTFSDVTDTLGVGGGKSRHFGMFASDLDNDRDIDLVVINRGSTSPQIFNNERYDRFSDISAKAGVDMASNIRGMTVADFNRDGAMDLFLAPAGVGSNILLFNRGNGTFERDTRSEDFMKALSSVRFGCGALDFDSDGSLDLYLFRNDGGELWQNTGDGRFIFAGKLPCKNGRAAASADFDGDGRPDIMYLEGEGALHLLENESRTTNHWLGIQLEGLRSNKPGFGAKVEVHAGEMYQKMEVQGHNGYLSQDSSTLWIGLGEAAKADSVTVRWPSGILQSEVNVPADQVVHIRELDRKGTSCPLLYTWNGRAFDFVTDFLGGCAIGALEGPMKYSIPDTDEYVRIEGNQLALKEGMYLLNLNNQLEEVIMFDQAQLLVVDHPAGTEIYPNERLMPAPPFPQFKIYTARGARPPVSAVDSTGSDILPLISKKDRVYPDHFALLPFKGYAENHAITLDLGDLTGAEKIVLLMDAWIDYADSSSNLAASQAGYELLCPYLQVKDASGKWKTAISSMGFPAGLPKTMTVDLTGKFPSQDYHVRVVTNMRIYWDRIRVDTSPEAPIKVTRLDPVSADLHFRGYPAYCTPDGKVPWIYDYGRVQPAELWGTHAGAYTRFGDVRRLLLKRDDKFVITRHGDEITLAFDAAQAPPLPEGWVRDYLLYADGYGKDMDINSLYPEVVGPLPFHAMTGFPYPRTEKYPDDPEHWNYQKTYNTRIYPELRKPLITEASNRQ